MSVSARTDGGGGTVAADANRFYRAIWRWHFYAGLLVIPVVIVLSITGAIYLFRTELDHVIYRSLMVVEAPTDSAKTLPASALVEAAAKSVPEGTVTRYLPASTATASVEIGMKDAGGEAISVYVDPYTGKVLGQLVDSDKFMKVVRRIHGKLLIGATGDRIVELAACWTLILTLTGLYLWWPRKAGLRGVLWPRLDGGRRIFWKDLHAVTGFYAAGFVIFLVMSGLPWSGYWGKLLTQIANKTGAGYPTQVWDDVPLSTVPTGDKVTVPWTLEQAPMPMSMPAGDPANMDHANGHHTAGTQSAEMQSAGMQAASIGIDRVIALAGERRVVPGYEVTYPDGPTGVYTVSVFPTDPAKDATLHVDRYSGKVLADLRFAQFGLIAKPVEYGVAIHMGTYFGLANQLILLTVCLALIGSCVTAAVMWWQRRPAGRLGAPPLPRNLKLAKGFVLLVVALGVLFPLAGMSLVAVLLFDWLVVQRVPALRTALA